MGEETAATNARKMAVTHRNSHANPAVVYLGPGATNVSAQPAPCICVDLLGEALETCRICRGRGVWPPNEPHYAGQS
jgi:hypothetical protein